MKLVVIFSMYVLIGLVTLVVAKDAYVWENPLWEIAIVLLWPLAFVVMILSAMIDYVNRVIKYYKKKGGRKNGRKKTLEK